VQEVAKLNLSTLPRTKSASVDARIFVSAMVLCTLLSAALASWVPLYVSIVTVFLFAGPHNWFELRYFLMRMPVRFGRSRKFFLTAFIGLFILVASYVSLPLMYRTASWTNEAWLTILALWNSLLLGWLGLLVRLRSKQKAHANWTWILPVTLALGAFNWLAPELFSLALVYLHPIVAFWFLDRHLQRVRPRWVPVYRLSLLLVPFVIVVMIWQLSGAPTLQDDNGLFWRITQHSGAELLPNISSHLLVSVHLFIEMLHYGVWIVALPLLGRTLNNRFWESRSIPLARHPRGFPRLIALVLSLGVILIVLLWVGFSIDYSTTRDIYFTLAIAHVIAEAPFLLRML
jgi:hypothetical protein